MFRGDFEFHDDAGASPSRPPDAARRAEPEPAPEPSAPPSGRPTPRRRSARSRSSSAARPAATPRRSPAERGLATITVDTLYDAKAHYRPLTPSPTPLRVVVVTMDSHLSGAAARAEAALQREMPGLHLVVHAADEWGSDPQALAACHDDIATRRHRHRHHAVPRGPYPRRPARPRRPPRPCDAMLCCMSANEVTRLTRLGRFDMAQEATGALAMLKKLRGGKTGARAPTASAPTAARRCGCCAACRKLMKFIPGTAQDVRTYFLALQYWLAGSDENLANLVRMLVGRYCHRPRATARPPRRRHPDRSTPMSASTTPASPGRITEPASTRCPTARPRRHRRPAAAALLPDLRQRRPLRRRHRRPRGPRPARHPRLRQRPRLPPRHRGLLHARRHHRPSTPSSRSPASPSSAAPPTTTAAPPRRCSPSSTSPTSPPTRSSSRPSSSGRHDPRGLLPVEATMMVAIPELDGAHRADDVRRPLRPADTADPAQAATASAAAATWSPIPSAPRTLAARVAAARSRCAAPRAARAPGRRRAVQLPAQRRRHRHRRLPRRLRQPAQHARWPCSAPATTSTSRPMPRRCARMVHRRRRAPTAWTPTSPPASPVDDHVRRQPWLGEIEAVWGPAPGRHRPTAPSSSSSAASFGNVFVGLQPAFGYEGDPMRLLFERGFAPTHAFAAFYRWIREDFRAHAVLHFGTHGALEFMPGKQAGLSAACWPDRLIGDLPNFNFYASNNPSEGMIAKRRAGATLISYLTPAGRPRRPLPRPARPEGLARPLARPRARRRSRAAPDPRRPRPGPGRRRRPRRRPNPPGPTPEPRSTGIGAALLELEYTLIPHGLHVIGEPPRRRARRACWTPPASPTRSSAPASTTCWPTTTKSPPSSTRWTAATSAPPPAATCCAPPRCCPPAATCTASTPSACPALFAVQDGARQADRLLARHAADGTRPARDHRHGPLGHRQPQNRRRPDRPGALADGRRARASTATAASAAPTSSRSRTSAARASTSSSPCPASSATCCRCRPSCSPKPPCWPRRPTSPPTQNYIRKHALAFMAAHGGTIEQAALRVFGNADGAYGANVNQMVGSGVWNDEDELADAYVARKGFAYGVDGRPQRADGGAQPRPGQRRGHLPEPRQHRTRRHHRRPLLRHARRHLPRRPPGPRRHRRRRLHRRPDPRRRHRPHAQRTGRRSRPAPAR